MCFSRGNIKDIIGIIPMNIFHCQVSPSIIRNYRSYESSRASIGVTSFRPVSFLFCLSSGCPSIEIAILAVFQDSRGICQFVPLDHRPPPTDLQLLHFSPPFLFVALSITVPLPIYLLLRFFTKFQVLFSFLSPQISLQLLHYFSFFIFLFLSSFSFLVFPFSSFLFISICRSHFAHFLRIFLFTDRHTADLPFGCKKSQRS